jgi:hypothetical protein
MVCSHDHTGWSHRHLFLSKKCPITSKTVEIHTPKSQVQTCGVPRQWPPLHVTWNYLSASPIFTADYSIDLTWTHWFCLRIVPLPDFDTHILSADAPLPDLDTHILSADCSVTWFWHTNFVCGLFRYLILTHIFCLRIVPLPDFDTHILSADCSVTWFWHTYFVCGCSVIWSWHTNFDCGLFRYLILTHWLWLRFVPIPDLDTLTLTAVCSVYLIWACWIWTYDKSFCQIWR